MAGEIAIITAVLGGVLSAKEQRRFNKAAIEAGLADIERRRGLQTQIRFARLIETDRLAREAQTQLGAISNVAPEGIAAIETIASRIAANVGRDQAAIDEERDRRLEAQEFAIEATRNRVQSQLGSVGLAAFNGAIEGHQAGSAIEAGIASFGRQQEAADIAGEQRRVDEDIAGQQTEFTRGQFEAQQTISQFENRDFLLWNWRHSRMMDSLGRGAF